MLGVHSRSGLLQKRSESVASNHTLVTWHVSAGPIRLTAAQNFSLYLSFPQTFILHLAFLKWPCQLKSHSLRFRFLESIVGAPLIA